MRGAIITLLIACIPIASSAETMWRFKGMTMAQFMLETMVTPTDYFDTGGRRVFIADKRAPDPRFGCSMQLVTEYNGKGEGADSWVIVQVRYSGGCDGI